MRKTTAAHQSRLAAERGIVCTPFRPIVWRAPLPRAIVTGQPGACLDSDFFVDSGRHGVEVIGDRGDGTYVPDEACTCLSDGAAVVWGRTDGTLVGETLWVEGLRPWPTVIFSDAFVMFFHTRPKRNIVVRKSERLDEPLFTVRAAPIRSMMLLYRRLWTMEISAATGAHAEA